MSIHQSAHTYVQVQTMTYVEKDLISQYTNTLLVREIGCLDWSGETKPEDDVDQKFTCSVVVPRNDTFVLKPVDCFLKYWTTCIISGDTKQMGFPDTYQSAIRRCSSSNGTILSIYNNLDNLEDGREYWSNINRSKFLKWITSESPDEICYEVEGLLNVDCLYLKVQYRMLKYIPLPCNNKYTAICKPKQPGDSDAIRQCPTTPSMPIKSTKVVASSTLSMSTKSISTNLDYTKFVKGSSTKEFYFSITTTLSIAVLVIFVVFVLVCLQISLITILRRNWKQTQEGNQYELTSQFTTEPRSYAQPEIQHYEVVDDIPS
ncbi:unnamed protein product [Mytilus coruscus]|uniref:C-type lectin domain-containing protein n=1 Tax=Mytilus coruscus TaxID=42192 RepID=A0A6J8AHH3_MYTCO|nr:unnamed protein product [Mytilus coruscus]